MAATWAALIFFMSASIFYQLETEINKKAATNKMVLE